MTCDVTYLTVDQVQRYHALVLEDGGAEGVRSEQMLASPVLRPQQSAFGEDAYLSIAEKAAATPFFLIQNHPFIDANKRTAALSMRPFLAQLCTGEDAAPFVNHRQLGTLWGFVTTFVWFDTDHRGAVLNWSADAPLLIGYSEKAMFGRSLPFFVSTNRPSEEDLLQVVFGHALQRQGTLRPLDRRPMPTRYSVTLSPDTSDSRPVLRWTFEIQA
jgi:hypothetical protein